MKGVAPNVPQAAPPVSIRLLSPADSLREVTALLHRAYRGQVDLGLRPLAGRQDVETTRKRCASGECYVAVVDTALAADRLSPAANLDPETGQTITPSGPQRVAGIILFHEVEDAKGPPWFQRKDVDYFSQFAVEPELQGIGVGARLLETVERRARECGAAELGLSMAEPDEGLMRYYLRRGYRFIEHWQWPYTNYRSAILSKSLAG